MEVNYLPKLQMHLALEAHLGYEIVIERPIRDKRYSGKGHRNNQKEDSAQVSSLCLFRRDRLERDREVALHGLRRSTTCKPVSTKHGTY